MGRKPSSDKPLMHFQSSSGIAGAVFASENSSSALPQKTAASVAKVLEHANLVFGNKQKAKSWLSKPRHQFSGKTPLEMLSTQIGVNEVENILFQIEYGNFA